MCMCVYVCMCVCEPIQSLVQSGMASCDEGAPQGYCCIKTFDCGSLWYHFVRACIQYVITYHPHNILKP